jgi:hypothetical protein
MMLQPELRARIERYARARVRATLNRPHQGKREMARRRRQLAAGQIFDHYAEWKHRREKCTTL